MATISVPALDNTLGVLFVGLNVATIMYGINCVQIFMYTTSVRSRKDHWWLKCFMYTLFILDTCHQSTNLLGMYRYLITDFMNPIALLDLTPGGGRFMLSVEACFGVAMIAAVQFYFSWRVWAFSRATRVSWRWIASILTVTSAILTLLANSLVVAKSFDRNIDAAAVFHNSEQVLRDWKIALPSAIVCDVIITAAMVINLSHARTGIPKTDSALNMLITFTVNTGLLTTLLTIASLVMFIVLPNSLIFAALEFIIPKSYVNSAMAVVNSREYLRDKIRGEVSLTEMSSRHKAHGPAITSYWEDRRLSRISVASLPPATYAPNNPRSPDSVNSTTTTLNPYNSYSAYGPYLRYTPPSTAQSAHYLATLQERSIENEECGGQPEDGRFHKVGHAI